VRDKLKEMYPMDVFLVEGGGGIFEITQNASVMFSKRDFGRFPTNEDLAKLNLVAGANNGNLEKNE
jgi:hypothetical protein